MNRIKILIVILAFSYANLTNASDRLLAGQTLTNNQYISSPNILVEPHLKILCEL
jgi:hypothetical protein